MRTKDTREAGEEIAGGRLTAARSGNGKGENERDGGMERSLVSTHAM